MKEVNVQNSVCFLITYFYGVFQTPLNFEIVDVLCRYQSPVKHNKVAHNFNIVE